MINFGGPLLPMMIFQLSEAHQAHDHADITINGREVKKPFQVTTVASVVDMRDEAPKYIEFELEDGSPRGKRIKAKFYYTQGRDRPNICMNEYVRVTGSLVRYYSRMCLEVDIIRKLEHPNEIDFHMLEVMFVELYHERGSPPSWISSIIQGRNAARTLAASDGLAATSTTSELALTPTAVTDDGPIQNITDPELASTEMVEDQLYQDTSEAESAPDTSISEPMTSPPTEIVEDQRYQDTSEAVSAPDTSIPEPTLRSSSSASERADSSQLGVENWEPGQENNDDADEDMQLTDLSIWFSDGFAENSDAEKSCNYRRSLSMYHSREVVSGPSEVPRHELNAPRTERSSLGSMEYTTRDPYSKLTTLQRDILVHIFRVGSRPSKYSSLLQELLQEDSDEYDEWEGADLRLVSDIICKDYRFSKVDVRIAIASLFEEGYIYETIDHYHAYVT